MSKINLSSIGPVLLVEDDETYRKDLGTYLTEQGLKVISVPSAVHAIKFFQNQPWNWYPALIITDIVMDGMGGYEFIRRIEEMFPKKNIPIVVVSKLDGRIDTIEAESAGAMAYMIKPISPKEVYSALVTLLQNKKTRMQIITSESQN